jgi:hypothetical protein
MHFYCDYSISKSIVSRRRAADSVVARQGEGNNDTIDLEMELLVCDFGMGYWHRIATLTVPGFQRRPNQMHAAHPLDRFDHIHCAQVMPPTSPGLF